MIKKIILSVLAIFAAINIHATTNVVSTTSVAKFGPEWNLLVDSSYPLSAGFTKNYDINLDLGSQVFFNKYVGIEAKTPAWRSDGRLFQEVTSDLLFRLPLFDTIAPYIGAGASYSWENKNVDYIGKVGVFVKIHKDWALFGELDAKVDKISNIRSPEYSIVGGLTIRIW